MNANSGGAMNASILQRASELAPKLVEIRRTIHRHPELGFSESRTAGLVAEVLSSLGVTVETGVGKTGVVGEMGSEGPVVALRADMDALPIQEKNVSEYVSQVPGVMHACGHDVHTACLLGAAMLLENTQPVGRVRFLFQPSEEGMDEEGKSGAMRMVEEGAIEDVEALFGIHVDSKYEAGTIACSPGYVMAGSDNFRISVLGRAAHGAQAHLGIDAVLLAAQVVNALHAIVSRRIPALESAVLSIGTVHGGTKENNLAEEVELRGTIRYFSPNVHDALLQEIGRACGITRALGGDYELSFQQGYPPLSNDSALAALARDLGSELVGHPAVRDQDPEMGSEDFSFFTRRAPGCYITLGARIPGQPIRPLHHGRFDVDESILPLGAAMMAGLAIRFLDSKPPWKP
jgi:amidohydrolase